MYELDKIPALYGFEGHYFPKSKGQSLDVTTPDQMDTATRTILDKIDSEVGGVDNFVQRKLKYKTKQEMFDAFKAEQIDALALAIYNIENNGTGLIVSDQTGIGKGRVAAGILRYARNIGKIPIFLTKDATLFSDIYRDIRDIGSDDMIPIQESIKDENGNPIEIEKTYIDKETGEVISYLEYKYSKKISEKKNGKKFVPFILNNYQTGKNPTIISEKADIIYKVDSSGSRKLIYNQVVNNFNLKGFDCVLATYSQFNQGKINEYGKVTNKNEKHTFLENLSKNNIVVLDESHLAAGEGIAGNFFREILPETFGVIYLSATYAKFSKNMAVYQPKTAIKDANLTTTKFILAMENGKNPLQEIMSNALVESGNLIRRERPLSNVKFNFITFDSDGEKDYGIKNKELEHNQFFDSITNVFRDVVGFQRLYIDPIIRSKSKDEADKYKGIKNKQNAFGYKNTPIFSKLFQLVYQLVFSIKAESIAERAIQRLKEGKKVVITFQSTMENYLSELQSIYGSTIKHDWIEMIKKGLDRTFVYTEITPKPDGSSDVQYKRVSINELEDSGKRFYYSLIDRIHDTNIGITISPIDYITDYLQKAGYSVGEITGRSIKLMPINKYESKIVGRKKEDTKKLVSKFQSNEIDVMLLNQSGSTGISLHAVPTKRISEKEVKPRVMIVAQPALDINTEVQMWGRINRTGQIFKPEYDILSLAVPAEQRLILMLQMKLRSLDSNTSSNAKQNQSILNTIDYFNKYGDEIVDVWLEENDSISLEIDRPNYTKSRFSKLNKATGESEYEYEHNSENCAYKTSGRIAILPIEVQKSFYSEITEKYIDRITDLNNKGINDLEIAKNINLEAEVLLERIAISGTGAENPFGSDLIYQKCLVNNLEKPLSIDEINLELEQNLNGISPEENQSKLLKEYATYRDTKITSEIKSINDRYSEIISDLKTKPSLLKIKEEEGVSAYQIALSDKVTSLEMERNDKILIIESKLKDQFDVIENLFKICKIGNGYRMANERETIECVFLGYKWKKDKKFVPSNITFRFAMANSERTLEFNPTGKYKDLLTNFAVLNSNSGTKKILGDWDKITKEFKKDKEERVILVGNILMAYKLDTIGKLIEFNYADGNTAIGMLMGKKFQIKETISVPIKFIKRLLDGMQENDQISTNEIRKDADGVKTVIENGITFIKLSDDKYKIVIPHTTKDGGKFRNNEKLYTLLDESSGGIGFLEDKKNNNYYGYLSGFNLSNFLKIISDDLSVDIEVTNTQYDIIKRDMPERKKITVKSNIIKLNVEMFAKKTKTKAVAGLSGNNDEEEADKMILLAKKRIKELKEKKQNLSGLNLSEDELNKKALEYNIDLKNINI